MKPLQPQAARRTPPHQPAPRQRGGTLIEVLVSLLLFSLGILGTVGMLAKSINTTVDAQDRSRAAVLANEIVAAMWLEGTASPSTLSTWKSRVADSSVSGLPDASASVTSSTDSSSGITTTTVTLSWKAPARASNSGNRYTTSVVIP